MASSLGKTGSSLVRHVVRRSAKSGSEMAWTATAGLSLLAAHSTFGATTTQLEAGRNPPMAAAEEGSHLAELAASDILSGAMRLGSELREKIRAVEAFAVRPLGPARRPRTEASVAAANARFPALRPILLTGSRSEGNERATPFPIGAPEPVEIDNELFVGRVALVLRPPATTGDDGGGEGMPMIDKDDTFQIQFQGRFKRPIDKDRIYLGGELVGGMDLGFLARKASELLLGLLSRNVGGGMTYSFGTPDGLPHISFPLHEGMQSVVASSSDGRDRPRMGKPFDEHEEKKIQRRMNGVFEDYWDPQNLYSMSFSAASIDIATWKVLVPFELDLSTFWGDKPIRLVIYHLADDDVNGRRHGREEKEYLFNLQIEHFGRGSDRIES